MFKPIKYTRHDHWREDSRVREVMQRVFNECPHLRREIIWAHDYKCELHLVTHDHPVAVPDKGFIARCWREFANEPDAHVYFHWIEHLVRAAPDRWRWPRWLNDARAELAYWRQRLAARTHLEAQRYTTQNELGVWIETLPKPLRAVGRMLNRKPSPLE